MRSQPNTHERLARDAESLGSSEQAFDVVLGVVFTLMASGHCLTARGLAGGATDQQS